ncbi:MAG: transcriptional regulator [Candidatus Riflebacteria bacterium]|nr:transcriptional regulator [Candidatus Riflebacteria bacterium]
MKKPTKKEISSIRESLALSTETFGRLLQVSSRTIVRWEAQESVPRDPNQVLRIHKLKEIVDLGLRVYTTEGLREFVSKPQPAFNGHTAYQLMTIGEYDSVLKALATDCEGLGD